MLDSLMDVFSLESEKDRQLHELEAMGDHELADLGISRDQIEAFAGKHAPEE